MRDASTNGRRLQTRCFLSVSPYSQIGTPEVVLATPRGVLARRASGSPLPIMLQDPHQLTERLPRFRHYQFTSGSAHHRFT